MREHIKSMISLLMCVDFFMTQAVIIKCARIHQWLTTQIPMRAHVLSTNGVHETLSTFYLRKTTIKKIFD